MPINAPKKKMHPVQKKLHSLPVNSYWFLETTKTGSSKGSNEKLEKHLDAYFNLPPLCSSELTKLVLFLKVRFSQFIG